MIPYWTYSGAGNDFVILKTEDVASTTTSDRGTLARLLCDRKSGIGSDGLILLGANSGQNGSTGFLMEFYNPDGSFGALCGNGARCAVRAANDLGIAPTRTSFSVLGQTSRGEIFDNGLVEVSFNYPLLIEEREIALDDGSTLDTTFVDVGSQHAVVFLEAGKPFPADSIESLDIESVGSQVRHHTAYQPIGANANFAEVRNDERGSFLRIRTFERGVEGETLACGTGCISTAIAAVRKGLISGYPVRLLTQSGEAVEVDVTPDKEVRLKGSAVKTGSGEFRISAIGELVIG